MNSLAVIYHSAQGHTEHIASHVADGARCVPNTEVDLLKAEDMAKAPVQLIRYDGFILGSPTYLGGVSGPFKSFMDTTGRLWRRQGLKGRLATRRQRIRSQPETSRPPGCSDGTSPRR